MASQPRTILVSNRLPVTIAKDDAGPPRFRRSSGGLVAGLADVHKEAGAVWVGHSGLFEDDARFAEIQRELEAQRFVAVPLPKPLYDSYYAGMANGTLWPLFHYFPGFMRHSPEDWLSYVDVNRRFCEAVLAIARAHDRVWVHDYQLMLLPGMLREALPELQIAYFHHIPFPSSEMFRILPQRQEVLTGLLGSDLIGMHTLDYVRHLLTCVTRLAGGDVDRDEVHHQSRIVKVGAFPLGVDVESTRARALDFDGIPHIAELQQSLEGKTVFLGVDRLDYTKGLPERFKAFRRFLQNNPEYVGKVSFLQVCVPSRQDAPFYADLRNEVERLVGQINGEFGRPGYVPLQYLFQPFTPSQVVAFYKLGDVMLVTPLRDGLNLVCKEYVAARDDDDGVLILSELAGAAAEMGEAILVNPFDIESVAARMIEAVTMPAAERRRRMQRLRRRVTGYNNLEWSRDFLRAWDESVRRSGSGSLRITKESAPKALSPLIKARRRHLFLDYDGTLVPIQRKPDLATPTPEAILLLSRLAALPACEVTVITGRSRAFCDESFSGLDINLVAEHCSFFRRRGQAWEAAFGCEDIRRIKPVVEPHLESFVRRIPGSFIEEKETSLVLHYRESEPVFAHAQALDLRESLCQILMSTSYSAFRAKRAIEVKPAAANKASAVEQLLSEWGADEESFLTAGDDVGDEDMFSVNPAHNLSIHVGQGKSRARYHVDTPADLHALLDLLARVCSETVALDPLRRRGGEGRPTAPSFSSARDHTQRQQEVST